MGAGANRAFIESTDMPRVKPAGLADAQTQLGNAPRGSHQHGSPSNQDNDIPSNSNQSFTGFALTRHRCAVSVHIPLERALKVRIRRALVCQVEIAHQPPKVRELNVAAAADELQKEQRCKKKTDTHQAFGHASTREPTARSAVGGHRANKPAPGVAEQADKHRPFA